jgi:hypothetical protein
MAAASFQGACQFSSTGGVSTFCSAVELIAYPINGEDVMRVRWVVFELLAQILDMRVNAASQAIIGHTIQPL